MITYQRHAAQCRSAEFYRTAALVSSYGRTTLRENPVLLSLTFSGFSFQASPLHRAKSPAKNVLLFLLCLSLEETLPWESLCFAATPTAPLVELSDSSDAPFPWTVPVICFSPLGAGRICETAKFENAKSDGRMDVPDRLLGRLRVLWSRDIE